MSFWRPVPSWGGWVGIALIVVLLAGLIALCNFVVTAPINALSFLYGLLILGGLVALAFLAYWLYGYYTLYYILDRDALRIHWAGFETIVPIMGIRAVSSGGLAGAKFPLLRWPGYCIGKGFLEGFPITQYYTRRSSESEIIITTRSTAYVISPEDPEGFQQALALRQSLGAVHSLQSKVVASRFLGLPFWSDHLAHRFLLAALVLNLGLFAYLCVAYPDFPPILPVHFTALGESDRLAPAITVFAIPAIGALGLILNSLLGLAIHSRERLATLLLWGGTVVIQAYLWVALLGITSMRVIGV